MKSDILQIIYDIYLLLFYNDSVAHNKVLKIDQYFLVPSQPAITVHNGNPIQFRKSKFSNDTLRGFLLY